MIEVHMTWHIDVGFVCLLFWKQGKFKNKSDSFFCLFVSTCFTRQSLEIIWSWILKMKICNCSTFQHEQSSQPWTTSWLSSYSVFIKHMIKIGSICAEKCCALKILLNHRNLEKPGNLLYLYLYQHILVKKKRKEKKEAPSKPY